MTSIEQTLPIDQIRVPRLLYGTAWKEDATAGLVTLALERGFRGIDTANQRRHYHEAAVGQAIRVNLNGRNVLESNGPSAQGGRFVLGIITQGEPPIISYDNVLVTSPGK